MKCRIIRLVAVMAVLTTIPAVVGFGDDDNEFKFTGTITSLPSTPGFIGDWTVSGRRVHVTSLTDIDQDDGTIAIGVLVKVEGRVRSDGTVDARKIEVEEDDDDDDDGDDDDDEFRFEGIVQSLPSTPGLIGDWVVSGRTVHVSSATEIDQEEGPIAVGATVKVEGRLRTDGSVDAEEIETKRARADLKFTGIIESLPGVGFIGDWRVGGRTVHVTSATRIKADDGPAVVGALVEVEGIQRADGSIDATEIKVKENDAELKGLIESLPGTPGFIGDWRVAGRTVHVSAATRIDQERGVIAVGAFVEVKGSLRTDGSIDATRIEVESGPGGRGDRANFKGTIESIPPSSLIGDWVVSGRLVHVISSTRLKSKRGTFAVGTNVKVKGMILEDGSTVATMIQLRK